VISQQSMAAFNSPLIPVRVENTSGLVIPPNSCVAIGQNANLTPGVFIRGGSGFGEGEFTVKVRRPDATAVGSGSPSQFMFTLDNPIPVGKQGYATPSIPVWAAIDSAITARAAKVGPVAGSFKLGAVDGFYHVRDLLTISSDKYALIEAAPGGNNTFGFKATAAVGQSSGTGSIYPMSAISYTGTPLETGAQIRASLLFGLLPINTLGICVLIDGTYYVTQAGCPVEEEYI
jgi:hypothetical protein